MSRESYAETQIPNFEGANSAKYLDAKQIVRGLLGAMAEVASGTVEGTGSAIEVETPFDPAIVILINQDDPTVLVHSPSMPAASGLKLTDAPALTFPTTNGVTLGSKGFTIGADADVNASGETLHWIAIGGRGVV